MRLFGKKGKSWDNYLIGDSQGKIEKKASSEAEKSELSIGRCDHSLGVSHMLRVPPHFKSRPWRGTTLNTNTSLAPPQGTRFWLRHSLVTDLLHATFLPSIKLLNGFFKRLKKISDQELQMRQLKKQGLEFISPWTVKPSRIQWVLTFLRIIRDLAVTFHKDPTTTWASSTCFSCTMSRNTHIKENNTQS